MEFNYYNVLLVTKRAYPYHCDKHSEWAEQDVITFENWDKFLYHADVVHFKELITAYKEVLWEKKVSAILEA